MSTNPLNPPLKKGEIRQKNPPLKTPFFLKGPAFIPPFSKGGLGGLKKKHDRPQ